MGSGDDVSMAVQSANKEATPNCHQNRIAALNRVCFHSHSPCLHPLSPPQAAFMMTDEDKKAIHALSKDPNIAERVCRAMSGGNAWVEWCIAPISLVNHSRGRGVARLFRLLACFCAR